MKKTKSILLVVTAFLLVFSATVTGYIFGVHAENRRHNNVKHEGEEINHTTDNARQTADNGEIEEASVKSDDVYSEPITKKYILKEENGKVILLIKTSDGKESVYKSYDISVNFLPESDRELLKQGIEAESIDEILQLIEDYM